MEIHSKTLFLQKTMGVLAKMITVNFFRTLEINRSPAKNSKERLFKKNV